MRRDELTALGIQLPVLPTIVRGALPGGAGWAARLARIGLDVVASGAARDTPEPVAAARAAAPHLPVAARPGDPAALVAAGAAIVVGEAPVAGAYRFGPDEAAVVAVDARAPAEDVMDVARHVLRAAQAGSPAHLWVVAGPGLETLSGDEAEAKLELLVEGARQARLYLAKEQFEL